VGVTGSPEPTSLPGPTADLAGSLGSDPTAGWQRLTALFVIASFIETVAFGHLFAFLPLLVRDLGVPEADVPRTVGFLSMSALLFGLPLVPFWGAWAERYSRKLIIVRSAVVEAVMFGLLAFATQIWQLFILVPLVGLNLGNTGVMLAEITDRAPRHRVGFAISLVGTAGPLGFAIGPAIGGLLADQYGVQVLFLLDSLMTTGVTLMLLTLYHERPDRVRSGMRVMALVRRSIIAVVRTPLARGVFVTYFFVLIGQRMVLPFLALYVEELNGTLLIATTVGIVAGAYGLAAAVGAPAAGILGDRVGYRRVLLAAIGLVVVCNVLASLAPSLLGFTIVYAFLGVGFATASSMLFTTLATGLPREVRSAVLNLALVPLYVSGILGSLLATQLLEMTDGDIRPLWLVSALFVAMALLPAFRLPRVRDHATSATDATEATIGPSAA
jgi:MFS transporter, DHA1 family, multidrug resistance protein